MVSLQQCVATHEQQHSDVKRLQPLHSGLRKGLSACLKAVETFLQHAGTAAAPRADSFLRCAEAPQPERKDNAVEFRDEHQGFTQDDFMTEAVAAFYGT